MSIKQHVELLDFTLLQAKLILLLTGHGQSETNASNCFTGLLDPPLTALGRDEAVALGDFLLERYSPGTFTRAYTSPLQRASVTLDLVLARLPPACRPPVTIAPALNERDYGHMNGRSKEECKKEYGGEPPWRRGFSEIPPGGESLEMTAHRVSAYYEEELKPRLLRGERLLVVSHGNTLRGLIMALEGLGADEIKKVELGYTATRTYRLDGSGNIMERGVFAVDGIEGGWNKS